MNPELLREAQAILKAERQAGGPPTGVVPPSNGAGPSRDFDSIAFPRDFTDLGNGRHFVERHAAVARYAPGLEWLYYTGKVWTEEAETPAHLARLWHSDTDRMRDELLVVPAKEQAVHRAWWKKCASVGGTAAMFSKASTLSEVEALADDFDRLTWAIPCNNCVLDFERPVGETTRAHSPDLMFTRVMPVDWDRDAECPRWLEFLAEVFPDREDVVAYLQRVIGYCLTGSTREHCFWILWGTGRNGKGVFLNTIARMMGPWAQQAARAAVLGKEDPSDLTALDARARLRGARLVYLDEPGHGDWLQEAFIKTLTGGDPITCRKLYGQTFTFVPTFKLFFRTNHKPPLRDTSPAMRARVKFISFKESFLGREDRELESRLVSELPGIFAWAIDGLLAYRAHGLEEPAEVSRETAAYLETADPLSEFRSDTYILEPSPGAFVTVRDRNADYKLWCEEQDIQDKFRLSGPRLNEYMASWPGVVGPKPRRTGARVEKVFEGLRRRTPMDTLTQDV